MTIRKRIETTLSHKRGLKGTYIARIEENLLYPEYAQQVIDSLGRGSGGELSGDKPKFQSVGSSSALAVNSFSFWIGRISELRIANISGFKELWFEKKLSTGLQGTPPNLDVYLDRERRPLCIEAKFLEPLVGKSSTFSAAYNSINDARTSSKWYDVYRMLVAEPNSFARLDVAQLVKHFFGIANPVHGLDSPMLVYLYWEPVNGDQLDFCKRHRLEIAKLADMVAGDSTLGFIPITYAELWEEWSKVNRHAADHVEKLRNWYEVSVAV